MIVKGLTDACVQVSGTHAVSQSVSQTAVAGSVVLSKHLFPLSSPVDIARKLHC